jgi:hypothetical protein
VSLNSALATSTFGANVENLMLLAGAVTGPSCRDP